MTYEEAILELEWVYQNGFENDLSIIGTDRILDSIRIAIECIEMQSNIVHCKDCENWKTISTETLDGRKAEAGQCELTKWLCGEQGFCMYGREVE